MLMNRMRIMGVRKFLRYGLRPTQDERSSVCESCKLPRVVKRTGDRNDIDAI